MSDNRRRYQNKGKQQSPEEKANMRRLIEEVKKQLPEGNRFTDDNIRSELLSTKMDAKATVENMSKPDFKPWTSTRPNRQNNTHRGQHSVVLVFNSHAQAEEPAPKKTHAKAKPVVEEKPVVAEIIIEEEKPVKKEEPEKPKEEPVKEQPKPEPEPVHEQPKEEPVEDDDADFADVPYQQTVPQQPVMPQIAYSPMQYQVQ